ncbi:MAG: class II aldolase/adducin family protein [Spirochaetia bacterium]|nr:class II aldolase/adducin family protein [Spirochaetia bacterium]
MNIKASGTSLKDMSETAGWRRVVMSKVLRDLDDPSLKGLDPHERERRILENLLAACEDGLGSAGRPSVESHIHAQLRRYVVHVHAILVGAFVSAKKGEAELKKLFAKRKLPPLWVPYCDPGFTLGANTWKFVKAYEKKYGGKPEIVFQGKHGVFVSADTKDKVLKVLYEVIETCRARIEKAGGKKKPVAKKSKTVSKNNTPDLTDSLLAEFDFLAKKHLGAEAGALHTQNVTTQNALANPKIKTILKTDGLTPDDLIYTNGRIVYLEKFDAKKIEAEFAKAMKGDGKPPLVYLLKNAGLFVIGREKMLPVIRDTALMTLQVRILAERFGGALTLTKRERDFIINWEVENYRFALINKK